MHRMQKISAYSTNTLIIPEEHKRVFEELCQDPQLWKRLTPWGDHVNEPIFSIEDMSVPNRVKVKTGPYVGSIKIADIELNITPPSWLAGLTPQHIMYMLNIAVEENPKSEFLEDFPAQNNFSYEGFVEPLFAAFSKRLSVSLKRGTYREYRTKSMSIPMLKGKIDWARQSGLLSKGVVRFATEHTYLTGTNPVNGLLAAACKKVKKCTGSETTYSMAHNCCLRLGTQSKRSSSSTHLPRRASHLTDVYSIGSIIIGDMAISHEGPDHEVAGIVVNLFDLFEKYVSAVLKIETQNYRLQEPLNLNANGSSWKRIGYPDIVFKDGSRISAVIDAKCKNIGPYGPSNDDLYQVFTYACTEGLDFAIIVHPIKNAVPSQRTFKMRLRRNQAFDIVCYGFPIIHTLENGDISHYLKAAKQLHNFIISEIHARQLIHIMPEHELASCPT